MLLNAFTALLRSFLSANTKYVQPVNVPSVPPAVFSGYVGDISESSANVGEVHSLPLPQTTIRCGYVDVTWNAEY